EHKLKGKAAIDGIGSRLGKSGGSLIHQGLIMIFYSLSCSTPYVAAILVLVLILWITAVRILGKQFQELSVKAKSEVAVQVDVQVAIQEESTPSSAAPLVLQPQA
ncbi:MAG: AAA family ATPase, partial [Verrucomicrobia bacterium]|nr:AAA family ATPase [Verrucomicrobiota bacterium]